ncbi:MAG: ABC transporter ATP-binding protein [Gammaproteobacteria bacterium]|nr:ABC transporter ATP-binding protein [Gammaproteobacteria bacterium]
MIRLEKVERTFQVGDQLVTALNKVDLDIQAGEYISIMGPSGSGKSTLLNILGLLDQPTGGRYMLDGKDVTSLTEDEQAHTRQQKIGFVFQFFHLIPRLTAAANIELPMILAGIPEAERKERIHTLLKAIGLENRADHRPAQLSGGQLQRIAIARAAVMQPKVLLADEPTGNLDQHSGSEIINLLEELNGNGLTLIVVTHDINIGRRAHRHIQIVDGIISSDDKKKI